MISAVTTYKLARKLARFHIPLLPKIIDYVARLIFSCWFPHTIQAGDGLVLGYGGLAIVVHSDSIIGNNVHIDQCVTIGGNGTEFGVPVIENDVYIGAGAKILGPITIGQGSIIGANAVVIHNIPAYSVAVGVPARVVKSGISKAEKLVGSAT